MSFYWKLGYFWGGIKGILFTLWRFFYSLLGTVKSLVVLIYSLIKLLFIKVGMVFRKRRHKKLIREKAFLEKELDEMKQESILLPENKANTKNENSH